MKLVLTCAVIAGIGLLAAPASALVACTKGGDCWHAEDKVDTGNVLVTYYPDAQADKIKADPHTVWHDADEDHNWLNGYWYYGLWYYRT